jgi:septal ring factor EnvC (AmiA/AmiB activator)
MKWLFLFVLLIGPLAPDCYSQTVRRPNRDALEQDRTRNLKKIEENERLLQQTQNNRENTLTQLREINQRIALRSDYSTSIDEEIKLLDREISDNALLITSLEADQADLRKEYGEMIYEHSKARGVLAKLSYIFAAESFNQAAARIEYLRQSTEVRRQQLVQIERVVQMLNGRRQRLADGRQRKEDLLNQQQSQSTQIARMTAEKSALLEKLKRREASLQAEIARQREHDRAITAQIESLAEGVSLADAKPNGNVGANVDPSHRPPTGKAPGRVVDEPSDNRTGAVVDPPRPSRPHMQGLGGRMIISNTPNTTTGNLSAFSGGKANLPWPVNEGVIIGKFGRQEHPVFEKVMIDNLGIDIRTKTNEPVRAIFAGKVAAVSQVPGLGYVVMLQHGEFFTVYARLKSVDVAKGEQVGMKDQLGVVGTNDEGFPELQFQIWRNQTRLNPEEWLAKQ